jgi:hypothetical protein
MQYLHLEMRELLRAEVAQALLKTSSAAPATFPDCIAASSSASSASSPRGYPGRSS